MNEKKFLSTLLILLVALLLCSPQAFAQRYTDNGDGTVTDTDTGLVWQQADDGTTRTWEEASPYLLTIPLPRYE